MNLKASLLLLLAFASTVTATAIALSIPAPVVSRSLGSMVALTRPPVQPLGDPISDPTFPH